MPTESKTFFLRMDIDNYFVCVLHTKRARIISTHGKYAALIRERLPKGRFLRFQFKHKDYVYFFNLEEHGAKDQKLHRVFWDEKHTERKKREQRRRDDNYTVAFTHFETKPNTHKTICEYKDGVFLRSFIVENVTTFFDKVVLKEGFVHSGNQAVFKIHPTGIKQEYRLS